MRMPRLNKIKIRASGVVGAGAKKNAETKTKSAWMDAWTFMGVVGGSAYENVRMVTSIDQEGKSGNQRKKRKKKKSKKNNARIQFLRQDIKHCICYTLSYSLLICETF